MSSPSNVLIDVEELACVTLRAQSPERRGAYLKPLAVISAHHYVDLEFGNRSHICWSSWSVLVKCETSPRLLCCVSLG